MILKIVNQFSCITYCLMIINHHTKFGKKKKKIERLRRYWADMIRHTEIMSSRQTFTDILNLFGDPDLEHSNPNFPQDSLAHNAVLSNQVWLQTNQRFRRYKRNSHILIISPRCDLDIEVSEPLFLHDTLAYDGCCITMPGLVTNILQFRRYCTKKHSLTFWTFFVTLTLNTAIPLFSTLYYQTKFGCKWTSSSDFFILN